MKRFVKQFSACGVLITCRVAVTDYSLEQFQYVEMADFDDEQIEYFIDRWFKNDEEKRVDRKKSLLKDKEIEAVRELAQVPLLLSLICVVFEETGEIPAHRHELYEEATDALLEKWDESRAIERDPIYAGLSLIYKKGLLAHIAFKTFEEGNYFLPEKEVISLIEAYLKLIPRLEKADGKKVLQAMEAQHGIFVERARRIHSFSHLTLQEYFAARYIVDNEQKGTVARLMRHVGDDRWREVFRLTAGMLDDDTPFFEHYLQAVAGMVQDDPQLVALLQWSLHKSVQASVAYKPPAVRAFILYHALALQIADQLNLTAFKAALEAIEVPAESDDGAGWRQFARTFAEVLDAYRDERDPHRKMAVKEADAQLFSYLFRAQINTFVAYLEANQLLVRCLQLAYVPDREAIENQFLLPPSAG